MYRSDIVTLIAIKTPIATDSSGFAITEDGKKTEVYADIKSVKQSEYYQAQQTGKKAEKEIKIRFAEYEDQPFAEVDGVRYKVGRTFTTNAREFIHLILSDLSEIPTSPTESEEK